MMDISVIDILEIQYNISICCLKDHDSKGLASVTLRESLTFINYNLYFKVKYAVELSGVYYNAQLIYIPSYC